MDKYAAARTVNLLTTVLGWATIALALLVALLGTGRIGLGPALTFAVPLAIGGLVLIALAQMAGAQLDTAESTARMAADMAEIRKRLTTRKTPPAAARQISPPVRPREAEDHAPGEIVMRHKGKAILREPVGFSVDGQPFGSIPAAKVWIEAEALRPGAGA